MTLYLLDFKSSAWGRHGCRLLQGLSQGCLGLVAFVEHKAGDTFWKSRKRQHKTQQGPANMHCSGLQGQFRRPARNHVFFEQAQRKDAISNAHLGTLLLRVPVFCLVQRESKRKGRHLGGSPVLTPHFRPSRTKTWTSTLSHSEALSIRSA